MIPARLVPPVTLDGWHYAPLGLPLIALVLLAFVIGAFLIGVYATRWISGVRSPRLRAALIGPLGEPRPMGDDLD